MLANLNKGNACFYADCGQEMNAFIECFMLHH